MIEAETDRYVVSQIVVAMERDFAWPKMAQALGRYRSILKSSACPLNPNRRTLVH